MTDERIKNSPEALSEEKNTEYDKTDFRETAEKEEHIWDMKQELEDYLEEQGIYIRQ